MDDLTKLEINLEKLSEHFFNSLNEVQKYAPLINLENEENMENSKENQDRLQFERIENYEEIKNNYQNNLINRSEDVNKAFCDIHETINNLRNNDDYNKTDEELKRSLRELKDWNELKVRSISEKIKHVEEIIGSIRKEESSLNNLDFEL